MSRIEQMLRTYPAETGLEPRRLAEVADKLYECAGVCLACADACSAETDPHHLAMGIKCLRIDLDCADICTVAARVLARQTGYDAPTSLALIEAARTVLRACADACAEMDAMDHCRICAETCRETEQLLAGLVEAFGTRAGSTAYPAEPPSATTPAGAALHGEHAR